MWVDLVLIVAAKQHRIHLVWLWLAVLPAGAIGLHLIKHRMTRVTNLGNTWTGPRIGAGPLSVVDTMYLQGTASFSKVKPGYNLERPNRREPEPLAKPVQLPPGACLTCGQMDIRMTDTGHCVPCVVSIVTARKAAEAKAALEEVSDVATVG